MRFLEKSAAGSKNKGAVLILSMVFMLLLAMVAGTVMQTSVLEFRMAGNDQFREEAFQEAQAIASGISEKQVNFPVTGDVGYTLCKAGDSDSVCDETSLVVGNTTISVPTGVSVSYRVERQGPAILESLPFRQSQSNVSSSLAYDAAVFEVTATVDGTAEKLGRAEVAHGIARLVVSSAQSQ
jgi:Tfp pilus assembly protein PilX